MEKHSILFDYEFPEFPITNDLKKDVKKNPQRYLSCDIRIKMGLFYTDEEKEKYIQKSLNTPLPGMVKKKSLIKRR